MGSLLEQILNGLTIGAFYGLIALGYNLVFGVMKVLNLAYGAMLTLGAYTALMGMSVLGLPFAFAVILGIAGATLAGLLIDVLVIRPIRASQWGVIVATLGVGQLIQFGIRRLTNGKPEVFPVPFEPTRIVLGHGLAISSLQVTLFAAAALLLLASLWLLYRTRFGLVIRAVAESPDLAAAVGVDRNRVALATFALTSAIGGAVGILHSSFYQTADSTTGTDLGLKCLVILIVAGVGNLPGSLAIALLLGVAEALLSGYGFAEHRDLITYGAMVLVLVFRPHGLFGEAARIERTA